MALDDSANGKIVSFQVYPSAILTDTFTDVKFLGNVQYEAASGYISPATMHANVYPTLPEGTPNDYRAYTYALIRKQDGKITAIGTPWIKEDTITIAGSVELYVTIRNKSVTDIPRIRQILTSNNIVDIDVGIKSNA